MRLKTLTPAGIVVDEQVSRVRFEALDGSFTFLPKHADFVTVIVPGIASFTPAEHPEREVFMACDSGVLVKDNATVLLSVRRAVISDNLAGGRINPRRRHAQHQQSARSAERITL